MRNRPRRDPPSSRRGLWDRARLKQHLGRPLVECDHPGGTGNWAGLPATRTRPSVNDLLRYFLDRPYLLQLLNQHSEVLLRFRFTHLKLRYDGIPQLLERSVAVNEVPDAGPDRVHRIETVNFPYLMAYGDQDDLVSDSARDEGGILLKDCTQRRHIARIMNEWSASLSPWTHRV